jgi:hypothetical protein
MKQTPNRLTPSSSESDSDRNRSSYPRIDDLNNVSSLFGSTGAGPPVGNSFRRLGSRPRSPMTREKLVSILQEALDIIDGNIDEFDDSEFEFGRGDKP